MHLEDYALHLITYALCVLSCSLNVFDYYLLYKSASIWTASWFPFCLHTEAKITDIILIAGETVFFDFTYHIWTKNTHF